MNHTDPATLGAQPAATPCTPRAGEFLAELGRIYLAAGLPLAAACEAALADVLFFNLCSGRTI